MTDELGGGCEVVSILASISNYTFWIKESLSFATEVEKCWRLCKKSNASLGVWVNFEKPKLNFALKPDGRNILILNVQFRTSYVDKGNCYLVYLQ